jgi:polysaccharide export outer membrane protein
VAAALLGAGLSASCAATPTAPPDSKPAEQSESQKLLEGDDIRIAFPGASNLDSVQRIRSDGKISMPLVGEVQAAGLTSLELQKILTELYATELIMNEVNVSIVASSFPVYVTGAVLSPGEVRCDRPITVFEVIMKAGGFDPMRAKLEKVTLIRRGEKNRELNMRLVMEGKAPNDVFVKPSDTIMVPDKKIWF